MQNLAGEPFHNETIIKELDQAGITYSIESNYFGEIKTNIIGYLPFKNDAIKFIRAWRYWVVIGFFPIDFIETVYQSSKEMKEIRAEGNIIFSDPASLSYYYYDNNGKQLFSKKDLDKINKNLKIYKGITEEPSVRFVEDPEIEGKAFIKIYHIDSQEGLNLFAQIVRDELKNNS